MAEAWAGWVLYEAENGHKYHYNHLTHESRWAVEECAEDHRAEADFQQYIRQRASKLEADEHDHADRLDAVEAGDGDDNDGDTVTSNISDFLTPYAGIGPITISNPQQENPRTSGIADRMSSALQKVLGKVDPPRQDSGQGGEGDSGEWDPELGKKNGSTQPNWERRGRTKHKRHTRRRARFGSSSSRSSSSSSSSSNSGSSSSRTSSNSSGASNRNTDRGIIGSKGNGHPPHRRHGRHTVGHPGRSSGGEPRQQTNNVRIESAILGKKCLGSVREKRESRTRKLSRRHYSRQRKANARRRSIVYSKDNCGSAQIATDRIAVIGRQAVTSVVKIACRAVIGGWKGMSSAALKAVRNWQTNYGGGLPIVVTPGKESSKAHGASLWEDPQQKGGEHGEDHRAPFREIMLTPGPPKSQESLWLSQTRGHVTRGGGARGKFAGLEQTDDRGAERAVGHGQAVERFPEEEGDVGAWVGGQGEQSLSDDRGTEEQKGGLASPRSSRKKSSV